MANIELPKEARSDAIASIQRSDISGELYADEFQYWPNLERKKKNRK
jgi:hypothetical protein